MLTNARTRAIQLSLAAALVLGAAQPARAVGTAATTSVDNRASITYSVGGVPQTAIESSPTGNSTPGGGAGADTSFLVDDMIDLTVAETGAGYTTVTPATAGQVLEFSLTNTGNATHDFSFSVAAQAGGAGPFGGTDNFDATGLAVFVEDGVNPGYQPVEDTDTWADELTADASVTVYVVGDIPGVQVNGDLAVHVLTARAAVGGGAGVQGADILTDDGAAADDPALVQTVFADAAGATDAANDGAHSAGDGYSVVSAQLTISKTSSVISDPVGGANPKAIPGAVVEYTITITNDPAAGAPATGITVSDSLDTEITAGTIAFDPDTYAAGQGIEVTAPNINGGAATPLTNAADVDLGDFGATSANAVTVTGIDLAAGESATVAYRVTVQ